MGALQAVRSNNAFQPTLSVAAMCVCNPDCGDPRFSLAPGISLCLARISNPVCDDEPSRDKIMKLLLLVAGLLCLMSVARGSDDELLVREVVKSFVTDYNNGDFKNAPSYTTDDWVHINPGGGITRGRDDVLKEVRAIHKTMLKGVSITIDSMTVRFVTRDVALVNAIHTSDSYVTPEDGLKHENERQMKTYVVVKHNGNWLLALDQNTIISNP